MAEMGLLDFFLFSFKDFLLKYVSFFLIFITDFTLLIFSNNAVKISEILNEMNLLKTCI